MWCSYPAHFPTRGNCLQGIRLVQQGFALERSGRHGDNLWRRRESEDRDCRKDGGWRQDNWCSEGFRLSQPSAGQGRGLGSPRANTIRALGVMQQLRSHIQPHETARRCACSSGCQAAGIPYSRHVQEQHAIYSAVPRLLEVIVCSIGSR
jgi:hypothetical protein